MGTRFKFSALDLPLDGIPVLGSQHASAYSVIVACIPRRSLSTFVNAFIQYVLMEPPSQVHSSSHYCNRGRLGLSPDPIEPVIISSASAEKFFGFKIVPVYRSCISGCSILLAWAFAEIADRRAISPLTSFELSGVSLRFFCRKRIHNRRPSRIDSFEDEGSIVDGMVHEKSLRHIRFVRV